MSRTTLPPGRTVLLREELPRGSRIEQAINRLRLVFLQLPGAQVSVADAARLTELDPFLSQILLNAREDLRFVRRVGDGLYQRLTD
jgi:hypothetical protein